MQRPSNGGRSLSAAVQRQCPPLFLTALSASIKSNMSLVISLLAMSKGGNHMQRNALTAIALLTIGPVVGGAHPAAAQFYVQHNLISDQNGQAPLVDPNLVNAWGLVSSATSPWWISDNGTGRTTLYNVGTGTIPIIFTVPGAMGQQGTPTGLVFNGGTGFVIDNGVGAPAPARFIFAGEDGTISGFKGAPIVIKVPNTTGAVYKGLAIDSKTAGKLLYATDFHNGRVDVFDSNFAPVHTPGAFVDPQLQKGFAPFGIQAIQIGGQTQIFVTYAKQDAAAHDPVPGQGLGIVSRFGTDGTFLGRVATRGQLNAPWGLALAPANFGQFSGHLLVGNFLNGQILAYKMLSDGTFEFIDFLKVKNNQRIVIDGLWALEFGSGGTANGPTNTLFFTAGPDEESHGLFGTLVAQ
jgi:uncharacterized protein (TIGR03118 family)